MKQPNWKTPLILSLVLAVGGTLAYWLEYSHKPKKEKSDTALKKPLAIESEDTNVSKITFRGSKRFIEMVCDEMAQKKCSSKISGAWTLNTDPKLKGDSTNIASFLKTLHTMVATETVDLSDETPEKRARIIEEYGLSETKRNEPTTPMIELSLENGKKLTAWFGTEHPVGDKTFVLSAVDGKPNDTTVFLISNYLKTEVDKDLTFFRDKTIFNFNRSDVNTVSAKTRHGSFKAEKTDKKWKLQQAGKTYDSIDYERFETLLSTISQMNAKDFVAGSSTTALNKAKSVATYELKTANEKIMLELFEKNTPSSAAMPEGHNEHDGHNHGEAPKTAENQIKTYLLKTSVRPDIVEVEAIVKNQLDKKVNDYRVTSFLSADTVKATTLLTLTGSKFKNTVQLKLDAGKWVVTEGTLDPKVFEISKISTLLETLEKTRIREFISPAVKGADHLTLVLANADKAPLFKLQFFKTKNELYLKNPDPQFSNEVFKLDHEMKNGLPL